MVVVVVVVVGSHFTLEVPAADADVSTGSGMPLVLLESMDLCLPLPPPPAWQRSVRHCRRCGSQQRGGMAMASRLGSWPLQPLGPANCRRC